MYRVHISRGAAPDRILPLLVAGLILSCSVASSQVERRPARAVDFSREVLPIISENCQPCHGLDTNNRQAGLRLDSAEGAYRTLASGKAAIVPGDVAASEMASRISATDGSQMPPPYSNKKLTAAQIAALKLWIAQGARYAPHWSYAPIRRPAIPAVKQQAWCLNPIDRFLLAAMNRAGLRPSPTADRGTLIRRLSLDLTGLPPTPSDVAAFARHTKPGAYEALVARLLASPHYGERMAVFWLDLVRYADTVGYHGDQDMSVWPYRDYVIRAFNENKPFDVFTREQLAGDLLPGATPEQRTASAYNRLGMMTEEGGAQAKEYLAKYMSDRIHNAACTWLAATLQCAQCHDHKYDPYTQKDFYSFGAFFADLKEEGVYGGDNFGPSLRLPTPAQSARLSALDTQIAAAKHALDSTPDRSLAAGRSRWEARARALDAAKMLAWIAAVPSSAVSSGGATLRTAADGTVTAAGALPDFDVYTVTVPARAAHIAALRLETLYDDSLPGNGIARAGTFSVVSRLEVATQRGSDAPVPVQVGSVWASGEREGFPARAMLDGTPGSGWGSPGGDQSAVLRFAQPLAGGPDVRLIVRIRQEARPRLLIGKFRISLTGVSDATGDRDCIPDDVLAALRADASRRTQAQQQAIDRYYRSIAPEVRSQQEQLSELEAQRSILVAAIPTTLVSEAVAPRTVRVLPRGNWMIDTGEVVQPAVPHFLPQIAVGRTANRLDLANWLVSRQNPLTARVTVDRLWKLFFGIGLAKNLDDFGVQGEVPVNAELLDWLASEFIRSGWNIKHMVRLMVTCDAYRESSVATPVLEEKDPFNRLCARQSMVRLDAEFIRDTALEVSGLLATQVGGPSVHPYEPRGYLAALNFPRREYVPDVGDEQYRRGVYTQWQRSFLHPALLAFDAPTREEGTCTRAVSNTPVQALVLLDDPTFVEAARVFAARVMRDGGDTFVSRLRFAYLTALARSPEPREESILHHLYAEQLARYASDPTAARALVSEGDAPPPTGLKLPELAAWTSVARALLNLNETITRS